MSQAVYLSRHERKPHGMMEATYRCYYTESYEAKEYIHWKHYVKSKDPKVMASYKKNCNSVRNKTRQAAVSYTHLTLPTKRIV